MSILSGKWIFCPLKVMALSIVLDIFFFQILVPTLYNTALVYFYVPLSLGTGALLGQNCSNIFISEWLQCLF